MTDPTYYLRTPDEMRTLFAEVPEALSNTLLIAERCNVDLDFKGYHLPDFDVPDGETAAAYLRALCERGLEQRYAERASRAEIRQRLDYELDVIHQMGFDTYFLIVWDLCRFAREQGIWYNARGSAAGSIVAYCLEITTGRSARARPDLRALPESGPRVDAGHRPGLPGRPARTRCSSTPPSKYGRDKVAQIITFGTLGARAAIRDVGRVMDIPLPEVDRVAKLVPNIPGKPMTIPEALEAVPGFKEAYEFGAVSEGPDRYRRAPGGRGAQRRNARRRRDHYRPAADRLRPAAPAHQGRRRKTARSRRDAVRDAGASNRSGCSRSISSGCRR